MLYGSVSEMAPNITRISILYQLSPVLSLILDGINSLGAIEKSLHFVEFCGDFIDDVARENPSRASHDDTNSPNNRATGADYLKYRHFCERE